MSQMTTPAAAGPAPSDQRGLSNLLAKNWWAVLLRGIAAIAFGLCAFLLPGATLLSLVVFFAAYAFVDGVFGIVSAVRAARQGERWGSLVAEGLVSIAAAAILVLWPGISIQAVIILLAAWAILTGVMMVAAAFRLNPEHGRVWLGLGGIASVVFGILLVIAPFIGALVVTWWLGAYAAVFGFTLIALAFTLKRRQAELAEQAA